MRRLVAVSSDGIRSLMAVTKKDFVTLRPSDAVGIPMYYVLFEEQYHVWPLPTKGIEICRLEPQEIAL